jgi:hypothetical protein
MALVALDTTYSLCRVVRTTTSNLNRAQWGDKFRWIVYNFHQELKVTPYEVSLKIGPQVRQRALLSSSLHITVRSSSC